MLAIRHTGQPCHGFTLTARCDDQDLIIGVVHDVVDINHAIGRNFEFANAHRHARNVDHTTSYKADFSTKKEGGINHHLDTMDIRGKHSHNDATFGLLKHIHERMPDFGFADGVALALHIGAFAHERQNAFLT